MWPRASASIGRRSRGAGVGIEQRADAQRVYADIINQAKNTFPLEKGIDDIWVDAGNHWRSETGAAEGVGLLLFQATSANTR
jgi:hypothetical protein